MVKILDLMYITGEKFHCNSKCSEIDFIIKD